MKLLSAVIFLALASVVLADCSCSECDGAKLKPVKHAKKHGYGCNVKVLYRGDACECQKPLPYLLQVPVEEKQVDKPRSYGYSVHKPSVIPVDNRRFIYNTLVEKPKRVVTYSRPVSYPVHVEMLPGKKSYPKYIYNTEVHIPEVKTEKSSTKIYTSRLDTVVLPKKDCPPPPCKPRTCSDEEIAVVTDSSDNNQSEEITEIIENDDSNSEYQDDESYESNTYNESDDSNTSDDSNVSDDSNTSDDSNVSGDSSQAEIIEYYDDSGSDDSNQVDESITTVCTKGTKPSCSCSQCSKEFNEDLSLPSSEEVTVYESDEYSVENDFGSSQVTVRESSEEVPYGRIPKSKPHCTKKHGCSCNKCSKSSEEVIVYSDESADSGSSEVIIIESSEEIPTPTKPICTRKSGCSCNRCSSNTESEEDIYIKHSSKPCSTPKPTTTTRKPITKPCKTTPKPCKTTPKPCKTTPKPTKATPKPTKPTSKPCKTTPKPCKTTPKPVTCTKKPKPTKKSKTCSTDVKSYKYEESSEESTEAPPKKSCHCKRS